MNVVIVVNLEVVVVVDVVVVALTKFDVDMSTLLWLFWSTVMVMMMLLRMWYCGCCCGMLLMNWWCGNCVEKDGLENEFQRAVKTVFLHCSVHKMGITLSILRIK